MSVAWPLRLYVDAACPLCQAEMCGLTARDSHARLQLVDCSVAGFRDAAAEAAGLDQAQLLHRIHALDAEGRWLVGVPVFAAAYEAASLHRVARLLRLRGLQPLWSFGYGLIADHRPWLVRAGAARLMERMLGRQRVLAAAAAAPPR